MMKYISICTAAVAAAFFACVQTVNAQTALSTQQSLKVSFKYKLRPLDLLEIRVFQEPDLQKTVRVAADGTIDLPLIGRLEVKGLTIQESQEKIRALYDKDYIVNPQVSVFILEYSPQRVHVIGQVNRNGEVRFPPEERMTLSKAIADAGGPTRIANKSSIIIKRRMPDGTTATFEQNLNKILSDENTVDFPLEDGDTIEVKESIF